MPSENDDLHIHSSFPLPYRALFLLGLGILGWATNLHGLDALGVNAVATLDLRTDTNPAKPAIPVHHSVALGHTRASAFYRAAYHIFFAYATFCFTSWALFRIVTRGNPLLVDYYGYIPLITAVVILVILVWPSNIFWRQEREKFMLAIRRCVFPPPNGPIYFSDVIFADIGTSFARVFGGIWLCLWMLRPGNSILVPPAEDGWVRWVFPTVMSIPFFLRFRQCLIEYNLPTNESQKPLFNAIKYATSFPVIFLSAAQRIVVTDLVKDRGEGVANEPWHGEHPLFRLWLLAAVVNSLYSFWWDVTNDWGLELLQIEARGGERQPPRPLVLPRLYSGTPLINRLSVDSLRPENHHAYPTHDIVKHRQSCVGLRPILLYPRAIYPVLVFVNLLLRMTWSIKLSTHVDALRVGSIGFFWFEVAELLRRWLWVFIRVEFETLRRPVRERVPASNGSVEDIYEYEMVPGTPDL